MRRILALLITVTTLALFLYSSSSPIPNISSPKVLPSPLSLPPSSLPSLSSSSLMLNAPLLSFQDQNGGELKMTPKVDYESFCFGADMFEQIKLSPEEKRLVNLIKGANDTNLDVAGDLHSVTLKPGQTGYYGVRILPPKRGEVTGVTFILTTVPISGVPDIVNNYFKIKYVETVGGSAGNVEEGTTSGKAYQVISPAGDIWFFFAFTAVVKSGGIRTTIEPHFFGGPHITSVEPQFIQCCCEHVKTPLIKVPEPTICWWYGIPYISDLYVWWTKYALYCKAVKNTANVPCTRGEATGKDLVIKGDGFNRLRGRENDLPTLITVTDDCGSVARVTEATIVSDTEIKAKIDITACRPGQKCVKISGVGGFGAVTFLKVVQDVPDTIVTQKRFTAVRIFGTQEKVPLTFSIDNGENITFAQDQRYDVTCVTRSSGTAATASTTGGCNNIATTTIQGTCVPGEDNMRVTGPGIDCVAPIRNAEITLVQGATICVGRTAPATVEVKFPSTYKNTVTLSAKTTSGTPSVIQVKDVEGNVLLAGDATTTIGTNVTGETWTKGLTVVGLAPGTATLTALYSDCNGQKCVTVSFTVMELLTLTATDKANAGNIVSDATEGTEITPVLHIFEDDAGKAVVLLTVTTDPATGEVVNRVKYTVEGATADPSAGAFDPAKPTEVTLTPTDGNRMYTITAWLDCDNDGNRDPGETTRVIEVVVGTLDKLRVADSVNADYYVEDGTAGGPNPVLYFCNRNSVKVTLSAAMLPVDTDKKQVHWIVEGNTAVPPKGNFATDPEVTLTPADDASRKFTVKAWTDADGNGAPDADEVMREVVVILERVDLVIPLALGVGTEVVGTLHLAGGDTKGKWQITYVASRLKIESDGAVIPSGQLSTEVTLPQTIPLKISALEPGYAIITAVFIAEGEEAGCADEEFLMLVTIDVDIDSNNNNYTTVPFQGLPDRGPREDEIEDDLELPGKVMGVNDNDDDGDGAHGMEGIRDYADFDNGQERDFVPIILEIPAPVDVSAAMVRITYAGSDPGMLSSEADPPHDIIPAEGNLRVWKKAGNVARNPASAMTDPAGDYVAPGVYGDLSRLGLSNENRIVTLYVEGIRPSAGIGTERILVGLDPDGADGPVGNITNDAVRLTIMRPDADVDTDRNRAITDADDPDEYSKGYYTWKGDYPESDSTNAWRPFGLKVLPVVDGVIAELVLEEFPAGGVISIKYRDTLGTQRYLKLTGAQPRIPLTNDLWNLQEWRLYPGDWENLLAGRPSFTVPGIYRINLRVAVDSGFSIQDEIRLRILDIAYSDTPNLTATLPDGLSGEMSIIPIFNPSPIVTLRDIANPGTGDNPSIAITGTVKEHIAPIEAARVSINGKTVTSVRLIDSGVDGQGPFVSEFNGTVNIANGDYLIEVVAVNGLRNSGRDSLQIRVDRDENGNITARRLTSYTSVPNQEPDLEKYRFKLRMADAGVPAGTNVVAVDYDTGIEVKSVELRRVGGGATFESRNLFLVPENLNLPADVDRSVADTRIKGKFGSRTMFTYVFGEFPVTKYGISTGILFVRNGAPVDSLQSGTESDVARVANDIVFSTEVGTPGTSGREIEVEVESLDHRLAALPRPTPNERFPNVQATVMMVRQSDVATDPRYNYYRSDPAMPLMAVRTAARGSANVKEIFASYKGYLKVISDKTIPDENVEPVSGAEFTAEAGLDTRPAGIIPEGSPAPPIVSVAQGAPRPFVVITEINRDRLAGGYRPTMHVKGFVRDFLADITGGGSADITTVLINGQSIPLTISRNANEDPPRIFRGEFDANVEISRIPDLIDILANRSRIDGPYPIVIAQESVIVRADNAISLPAYDTAFVKITDPDGNGEDNFDGPLETRIVDNYWSPAELPQRYYAEINDPFREGEEIATRLVSRDAGGNEIASKHIVLRRGKGGHIFRYGPFITASRDPRQPTTPPVSDDVPLIFTAPGGALVLETPAPMRNDEMECVGCNIRLFDNRNNEVTDTFLPTGSAQSPTTLTARVEVTHAEMMAGTGIEMRLFNTTRFAGHCNNAPRAADAAGNEDDFSFRVAQNATSPPTAPLIGANGSVSVLFFSKDNGGRTELRVLLDLPGSPWLEFAMPRDSDGDFLPDLWEVRPNVGFHRDGQVDLEDAGGLHNEQGDGFTALEEYRGFLALDGAGAARVMRMDEIPNVYGLGGNGGPQIKDMFIFIDTSVAFGTTYSTLFDVGFHRINPAQFSNNLDGSLYSHDHDVNFKGDNDGFNASSRDRQKAIHIRDSAILGADTLARAASFILDDNDIQLNASLLVSRALFPAATLNDQIIFHEIGHKCSLRHNLGTLSNGVAAFDLAALNRLNNTDVNGNGTLDGVIDIAVFSYVGNDGLNYMRGKPTGEVDELVTRTGYLVSPVGQRNYSGIWSENWVGTAYVYTLLFDGDPIELTTWTPATRTVRGSILVPEIEDWTQFLAPGGPVLQRNISAGQMDNLGNPLGGGGGQSHAREVRLRSHP